MNRLARMLGAVVLALASGCTDYQAYEAPSSNPLRGRVLGETPTSCDGGTTCQSFLRRGFAAGTEISMTFDPDSVTTAPGSLTTTGPNGTEEPCGPTFTNEPMLPIAVLPNDQLSLYDFPGGGRVRNYMFTLRPSTGKLAGRDVMAFVSLLRGGKAEIRIVAGSGQVDCDPNDCATYAAGQCDFYGVFPLAFEAP
ncbi:MAG: hypothetical protein U0230_02200 [Polyangiales bacterium]